MTKLCYKIKDTGLTKQISSESYNSVFNRDTLTILRWGTDIQENPSWNPYGPEVASINTKGMSMELYTVILDMLTQNGTLYLVCLFNAHQGKKKAYMEYAVSKSVVPSQFHQYTDEEDASRFSLYVTEKGIIKPHLTVENGIDIMTVNNLYKDVWQSKLFKEYRWKKLQELI